MMRTSNRPRLGSPILDTYLSEIRTESLLTAQEESQLALAIERGDRDARARMIQANLRLVVKIARQFAGRGLGMDDLIGEGNLGLIRAAQDFNPRFGTRFSTYAAYWIRQAIHQALINTTATIRLPAHMVLLLGRWNRTTRTLARALGREPRFEEVADALELTVVQRDLVAHALRTRHLVRESSQDADSAWSSEEASDPHGSPDLECESREEQRALLRKLDRLDERERAVVVMRFGLGSDRPLTLKEIGQRLNITREWVRKIELRAVRKLDDRRDACTAERAPARKPKRQAQPMRRLSLTA